MTYLISVKKSLTADGEHHVLYYRVMLRWAIALMQPATIVLPQSCQSRPPNKSHVVDRPANEPDKLLSIVSLMSALLDGWTTANTAHVKAASSRCPSIGVVMKPNEAAVPTTVDPANENKSAISSRPSRKSSRTHSRQNSLIVIGSTLSHLSAAMSP